MKYSGFLYMRAARWQILLYVIVNVLKATGLNNISMHHKTITNYYNYVDP